MCTAFNTAAVPKRYDTDTEAIQNFVNSYLQRVLACSVQWQSLVAPQGMLEFSEQLVSHVNTVTAITCW